MKHSIYPFSAVLRALRKEANQSPEEAAVLTGYPKYRRWESGKPAVKPEYLPLVADAFGIDDDLWLLVYAWLVDTLTPGPGEPAAHVSRPVIELLSALPNRRVSLPEVASLLIGSISHSELAAACLMARYGPSPGATDAPMILRPTKRSKLAASGPGDTGVLMSLYGDVLGDWLRSSSLTGILAGMGQLGDTQRDETSRRTLTAMMAPGAPELLAAAASANPITGNERGLDQLPSLAARELPEFMAMFARAMEDLRRLQDATARRPMSREEFLATLMGLAKAGPDAFLAEDCPIDLTKLPELDRDLAAKGKAMFDRLDRDIRGVVSQELIDAAATANPAAAVDAIARVKRENP
jgi:transcriptional regulator with XRE-family HTH domain